MVLETLNRYYDLLFPLDTARGEKIARLLQANNAHRVLDAGCATGSYTLFLAARGFHVTGIDLNPAFIAQAGEKGRGQERAKFVVGDIATFTLPETFAAILCIGNTLPLLPPEKIKTALANFRKHLQPGGFLVLQTVNFELFLTTGSFPFPEKKIDEVPLIFRRSYQQQGELIRFRIELVFPKEGRTEKEENLLYPTTRSFLTANLLEAGFSRIAFYSDFSLKPFSEESRDLITIAHA